MPHVISKHYSHMEWFLSWRAYSSCIFFLNLRLKLFFIIDFRVRGRERERWRELETSMWERHYSVASLTLPDRGSNPRPRYALWWGIGPASLQCTGLWPNQLSHPARASYIFDACFLSHFSPISFASLISNHNLTPSLFPLIPTVLHSLRKWISQGSYLVLFIRTLGGIMGICCLPSSHIDYPWALTIRLLHHLSCGAILLKIAFDPDFPVLCLYRPLKYIGGPRWL